MRINWMCRWLVRSSLLKSLLFCCAVLYVVSHMLSDLHSVPAQVYAPPTRPALLTIEVNSPRSHANDPTSVTNRSSLSTGPALDWLEAEGTSASLYLYSAYLDERKTNSPVIRLIAIAKRRKRTVECSYFSDTDQLLETKPGTIKPIRENWNLAYTAAFVLCPLPAAGAAVARVGVSSEKGSPASRTLSLPLQSLAGRPTIGSLSVCVKPLHYNFNRAVWLVEFIEMYRLLGADRFIFYNHTVGPDVEEVLRHYTAEGVVEVLPWDLPVTTKKDIRTEGIFASLNDCSLRSVGHFPFTAYVDLDEYLIPRQQTNLLEMLGAVGQYDAYVFQNVFFYLYWENDTAVHTALSNPVSTGADLFGVQGAAPYLLTQTKTRRLSQPHRHGVRSKYIARPERVVEVGNHIVWEYVDARKKVMNVPDKVALSHHYRICEFGGFDCLKASNQVDRIAQRHMMPLLAAMSAACGAIFPDQPACPPAPPLGSPW